MKTVPPWLPVLLLAGCAAPQNPAAVPMRAPGLGRPPPPGAPCPRPPVTAALTLPERIEIPAAYRLVLLQGRLTLVRETDAAPPGPAALQVVAGGSARPDPSYQPALLPQELAAELGAARQDAARLDRALADVMERSRTLAGEALDLKAQSQKVSALLAAAAAPPAPSNPAATPPPPAPAAE